MEKLYQYLWKSGIAGRELTLTDGRRLTVFDPGVLNNDAGPDFFNAKIMIDGTEWVGNVEIHVKASDWHRHGHDGDRAYDSVMLHAVAVADSKVTRSDGSLIPTVELVVPQTFYTAYAALEGGLASVRCASGIPLLSPLHVTDWIESLAVERLQTKASRVAAILDGNASDWRQAAFVTLARALGFGLNSQPFEMLGRSLPLGAVSRHSDSIFQIEALLFGQAGMLDPNAPVTDVYHQSLCQEYTFLARKYGLRPIPSGQWRYARTRPQNFPHRRIAFLAKVLEGGFSIADSMMRAGDEPDDLRPLFGTEVSEYWKTHASFGLTATGISGRLSKGSVDLLIINAVAPLAYAFASMTGDYERSERIMSLLGNIPAENNSIVRQWTSVGIRCRTAWESQALIHLRKEYCDTRKCLYCRFGHRLLRICAGKAERTVSQQIS